MLLIDGSCADHGIAPSDIGHRADADAKSDVTLVT
jgi:hypothetical protein